MRKRSDNTGASILSRHTADSRAASGPSAMSPALRREDTEAPAAPGRTLPWEIERGEARFDAAGGSRKFYSPEPWHVLQRPPDQGQDRALAPCRCRSASGSFTQGRVSSGLRSARDHAREAG